MIEPKTLTTIKFITFMAIAFGVAMIPMILAGVMLNKGNTILFMFLFRIVAVMIPLIAVIISGAGFKKLGFKPKKFRFVPLALVGPQILVWIGMAIYFAFDPDLFKISYDGIISQLPSEIKAGFDPSVLSPEILFVEMIVLSLTALPISQLLPSLGEEAGWRGVLYPFLKDLLGTTLGRIVGGILWGIWHWPLIYIGSYFYGNEYPGFPVLGPIMICVALMAYGIFIDYLYEKSGSILVASLAHGAMNAASMPLVLIPAVSSNQLLGPSAFSLIPIIPVIVIGVVITVFSKKQTAK
ncbi:MAG: CPBP family intramembrane metalloprotease [Clostridiales bacterium]|nr:CPBP family intramembrane metalloprotease [Clostridiales bacterium]